MIRRSRLIRRSLLIVVALHIIYAALWIVMDGRQRLVFERYAVLSMELIACLFYGVLIIAFYEARKTRLNVALAVQKFFWWLLITFLALPTALGLVTRDAPYRTVSNPYALWIVPAWLRTYIWIGLAVSLIGVLYEFWATNWGPHSDWKYPAVDRRRPGIPGRRRDDWDRADLADYNRDRGES